MTTFLFPHLVQPQFSMVDTDDSEANLHSFQGNEAGQDLDYEPGLEFDDTELAKAAIELATTTTTASATTNVEPYYLSSNNKLDSKIDSVNHYQPQQSDSDNNVDDGIEIADTAWIILDDNPLFSIDSNVNEDYCDNHFSFNNNDNVINYEQSKHKRCDINSSSLKNNEKLTNNKLSSMIINDINHNNDDNDDDEEDEEDDDNLNVNDNHLNQIREQLTRPNRLCTNIEQALSNTATSPSVTTPSGNNLLPIDVSSIYLHSPDELLEENFEEALREQYTSLPPLDPALDLALYPADGECDENFDDITKHGIVGVAGDDKFARKIITIYACRLPSNKSFNYAKFLR